MKDTTVWEGKSFTDILRDIHDATLRKRETIDRLIMDLRALVVDPNSAVTMAPIIKGYLEVMISNDEHLVKIATIVQRMVAVETNNKSAGGLEDLLSDQEKELLMKDALKELDEATTKLEEKLIPVLPFDSTGSTIQ